MSERFERFGPYVLLEPVRGGGMARLDIGVSASHPGDGLVVIKRLCGQDPELDMFFEREAKLTALFSHPNLVKTLGIAVDGDEYAMVLEHIDGHSLIELLREYQKRGTHCPPAIALRIAREVLIGLAWVHGLRGHDGQPLDVVHRDVTPHNIMVTREGLVKLIDFGIARLRGDMDMAEGSGFKGKVGYSAPEQLLQTAEVDHRADVFSLGVVLYELLTGTRLAHGKTFNEQLARRLSYDPSTMNESAPWIEAELAALVQRAMAQEADARFATAAEMRQAIDRYGALHGGLASDMELAVHLRTLVGQKARERGRQIMNRLRSWREQRPSWDPENDADTLPASAPPGPRSDFFCEGERVSEEELAAVLERERRAVGS
jgi:serine/threonine-protein kinase